MRNVIIWLLTFLTVWFFPARWGAKWLFPEVYAQFGPQLPWIMAWGAVMFFIVCVTTALLAHDK